MTTCTCTCESLSLSLSIFVTAVMLVKGKQLAIIQLCTHDQLNILEKVVLQNAFFNIFCMSKREREKCIKYFLLHLVAL